MVEGTKAIINFGELSKPATVLIEKISEAVGGIFKPYQIKRVARADAEASKIKAQTDIEISEIQQRAFIRFINEETRKQINMEEITAKAIGYLSDNAKPEKINDDWLANFFEKGRMVSDQEMQNLWAKILAGEANENNSFSKRTVNLVAELDKSDALLFTKLCSFCWDLDNDIITIIFYKIIDFHASNGINYYDIKHLDSIGLINYQAIEYILQRDVATFLYFGKSLTVNAKKKHHEVPIGNVILTKAGEELFHVCEVKQIKRVFDSVVEHYKSQNFTVS